MFLQYHWRGYLFWIFCLIVYQSTWYQYLIVVLTFVVEEVMIATGAWFFWVIDSPYKAGVTFISEYLIIICLRWAVVMIFQFQILKGLFDVVLSLVRFIIFQLRKIGQLNSGQPRNLDGTYGSNSNELGNRRPGRPKRS